MAKITKSQQLLDALIALGGSAATRKIASKAGLKVTAAFQLLPRLANAGEVKRISSSQGPDTVWALAGADSTAEPNGDPDGAPDTDVEEDGPSAESGTSAGEPEELVDETVG